MEGSWNSLPVGGGWERGLTLATEVCISGAQGFDLGPRA